MKKLFYTLWLLSLSCVSIFSQEDLETTLSLKGGVVLSEKYIDGRIYTEFEKENSEESSFNIKTWATKIHFPKYVSTGIGNFSMSGIWSKFNDPCPTTMTSLKTPFEVKKVLVTTLPTSSSSEKSLIATIELDFPFLQLSGYIKNLNTKNPSTGLGLSFQYNNNANNVALQITTAWQKVPLNAKTEDTWFVKNTYFNPYKSHSIIQQITLKTVSNIALFSGGITQMPFVKNAYFVRLEDSIELLPFLLNTQFFLCSKSYLNHKGSFVTSPMVFSLNPQLRFFYEKTLIKHVFLGGMIKASLEKVQKNCNFSWIVSYKGMVEIDSNTVLVSLEADISDIFCINFSCDFNMERYVDLMKNWKIDCEYSKPTEDTTDYGNIILKNSSTAKINITTKDVLEIQLFSEGIFDLNNKKSLSNISLGCSCGTELKYLTLKGGITYDTKLTKENEHSLHAEFSAQIHL